MVLSQPRASTSAFPVNSSQPSNVSGSARKGSKSSTNGDNASAGSRPSRKTALAAQEQVKSLATSSSKKRKPKSEIDIVIDTAKKPKVEQATTALRVLDYKPPEPKKPKANGDAVSKAQGKDVTKQDPDPSSKDTRDRAARPQAKDPSPPPPPKRRAPQKPNLKDAPMFTRLEMSTMSDSGALNDSRYLERLHLREFFARFVHLLYPPVIELEQRTARRRARKSLLPAWLTAALSSHLTTFWDSDQHPLGLLLAILTAMENEMKDAGTKYGEPLLKRGKASHNLFRELIHHLDQLDLDDLNQAATSASRLWIAASKLLSEEDIPAFRLANNIDATPEERKAARRAQASDSSASESESESREAGSDSSDSSDGELPASEAVKIQRIPPQSQHVPQKKAVEESESEPSSSDDEDAGSEQPATTVDPTLRIAPPPARPSKTSMEQSSSISSSGSSSSSSESSSEQSESEEEAVSTSSSAKQPRGRRSNRVSEQEKHRQDKEAAAAKAARLSRLRKGGRTTRASAPTEDERAQLEAQKEQETEAAREETAALKARKKSKKREPLLNKFSPSRRIEDFERQYIILGYVDLLISRSGDFRSALDEGTERQKQAKTVLRKSNGEFMQAKSDHQKNRPGDQFSLPKWMRIGDELVARHEETVARLYPGASTSHLRFQLHQAFYNIFIPTVLPDGLNSRPASTNHEVIDPSLLGVADGSLMSFSASLPPSPLAPWTVLAQGPAPPSSWFTATASGAVRSVDYLSQPSHRMPWHKFQKPEEIRELINVLEAQIKIRVWERKMTAFENETDKGALPRDSTATEASTAKIAEELVQEAEERRAHEIVSSLDKFASYYEHVLQS